MLKRISLCVTSSLVLACSPAAHAHIVDNVLEHSAPNAALRLSPIGSHESGVLGKSAAEIVAYHAASQRILTVNARSGEVDILDGSDPSHPHKIGAISAGGNREINSVSARPVGLAATAVAAGLVAPATASATEEQPKQLSAECQAEVDKDKEEHLKKIKSGELGSSARTPQELMQGLANGYGSSGMPKEPDCVAKEAEQHQIEALERLPIWGSSTPEKFLEVMSWVTVAASLVAALLQAFNMVATVNPAVLEPMKNALKQLGVRF